MWYYLDTVVAIYHGPTMRTSETAKEMVVNEKVIRFSPSFIHLILSLARSLDFFLMYVYHSPYCFWFNITMIE